jgi:ABC-type dipeptide/oligopeptide/nickel transport system permease subunit
MFEPAWKTLPPIDYVSMIRSLYAERRVMMLGALASALTAATAGVEAQNPILLGIAVAFVLVGVVRYIDMSAFDRRPINDEDVETAKHWEVRATIGAAAIAALYGFWVFYSFVFVNTHFAEMSSIAVSVSVLVGVSYGAVAGFYGGKVDEAMMRFVDFMYGLPYMFLVILIMLMFSETARGEMLPVFLALGLVQWLTMARIVRGQVLSLRRQEFVLAAELLGASDARTLLRHVLPNVVGVIVVYATLMVPSVIILESFLSFLGLGVALSWGQLVSDGVAVVNPVRSYWWLLAWPSGLLGLTLLSLNFIGDGLRDALDPKTRT